jgi:hypothetical protein
MRPAQALLLDLLPNANQAGMTTAQLQEKLRSRAIETKWLKSTRRALQRMENEGLIFSERQGRHLYWRKLPGVGGIAASSQKRMTLGEALALRVLNVAAEAYRLPWIVRSELNPMFHAARDRLERSPIGDAHQSWIKRIAVLDEGLSRLPPAIDPAVAETVSMALFRTLRLSLSYLGQEGAAEKKTPNRILVEPLGWVARNRLHYLVARKSETGELRHYRIDRIQSVALERSFHYPADFSLQSHIEDDGAFDYPKFGETIVVVLRFAREWGAHLLSTPVNETQTVVARTRKSLTVRFEALDSERLLWWIRGFGPYVEVLEPENLRLALQKEAARSARMYGGKAPGSSPAGSRK